MAHGKETIAKSNNKCLIIRNKTGLQYEKANRAPKKEKLHSYLICHIRHNTCQAQRNCFIKDLQQS